MKLRCDYCGCLLRYEVQQRRRRVLPESQWSIHCTPKNQQSQLYKAISEGPFEDFWSLGYTCPGCGGEHELRDEIPEDEARRVVAQHNALLETPEAQQEIRDWSDEVERRTQRDAQEFARLFAARFPETQELPKYKNCLIFSVPSTAFGVGLIAFLPWDRLSPYTQKDEIPLSTGQKILVISTG